MPRTSLQLVRPLADKHWRSLAACRSADPDLFFPISLAGPSLAQEAQAKAICAGCQVRRECLAFALRTHQAYGVWGGLSERERHPEGSLTPTTSRTSSRSGRAAEFPGQDQHRRARVRPYRQRR